MAEGPQDVIVGSIAAGIGLLLCLWLFGWWGLPLWGVAALVGAITEKG